MSTGTVLLLAKLLDLILVSVTMIPAAKAQANKLIEKLKLFAAEGRDPTDEEWVEINIYTDGLLEQLREAGSVG